jgi:hypothetical protein
VLQAHRFFCSQSTCPVCKEEAKSARYSFQLNNILEFHRQIKKRKITKDEQLDEQILSPKTSEEIFPNGSPYDQSQPQDTDDDAGSDESEFSQLPATTPTQDGVLWPCASCVPGNATGYTCTLPIPQPVADEAADNRSIPSPPSRGVARLALVDPVTRQFRS